MHVAPEQWAYLQIWAYFTFCQSYFGKAYLYFQIYYMVRYSSIWVFQLTQPVFLLVSHLRLSQRRYDTAEGDLNLLMSQHITSNSIAAIYTTQSYLLSFIMRKKWRLVLSYKVNLTSFHQIWAYLPFERSYFTKTYLYFHKCIWHTVKQSYLDVSTTKYNFKQKYTHIWFRLNLDIRVLIIALRTNLELGPRFAEVWPTQYKFVDCNL